MLSLKGNSLDLDLKDTEIATNLGGVVNIAKDYGTEAGSGGRVTVYTGSFEMVGNQQIYDLGDDANVNLESGSVSNGNYIKKSIPYTTTSNNKIF